MGKIAVTFFFVVLLAIVMGFFPMVGVIFLSLGIVALFLIFGK